MIAQAFGILKTHSSLPWLLCSGSLGSQLFAFSTHVFMWESSLFFFTPVTRECKQSTSSALFKIQAKPRAVDLCVEADVANV
jgi:hypothetical protein